MNALPRSYVVSDRAKNVAFIDAQGLPRRDENTLRSPYRGIINFLPCSRLVAVGDGGNVRAFPQPVAVKNRRSGVSRSNHDIGILHGLFGTGNGVNGYFELLLEFLC